ncbi:MAG: AAA family ATPase [Epsilonproteobacteria bacterium]|nr:AAA family ATPase [Campylobacterota bacterium]
MKKPVLIIIAGPNGSGKTSITSKILQHEWVESCLYINPDAIANDKFGDWNSYEAVLSAAKYSTQMREECIEKKEGLIFETVLSADDKIDFILRAKQQGYFIRLFFVGTESPTINASRIAQRVMEGGHDVPITKIISRYGKSITNCCIVASIVDRVYIYDNSVDFADPQLLFKVTDGKFIKEYKQINEWAQPILNFLHENPSL